MKSLLILSLLASSNVFAQILTWDDIAATAVNNLSLQSSEKLVEASEQSVKKSAGAFLPTFSITGTTENTKKETYNTFKHDRNTTNSASASIGLNIFSGFSDYGTLKGSVAEKNEANSDLAIKSADIRYQLQNAYFDIFINQERVKIYQKVLKRREQNEKLVTIKYGSGTEANWNVNLNKAEVKSAEFNLKQALSDLEQSKIVLTRLLNVNNWNPKEIEVAEPKIPSMEKIDINSTSVNHPSIAKLDFQAKKYSAAKIVARAAFLPSIDFTYSKSRSKIDDNARIDYTKYQVTATWNLFNGLTDFYSVQKAAANQEAIELSKEASLLDLQSTLEQNYRTFQLAQERLPIMKSRREAMEARVQTVSAQYRSGLKTYLDWEQAENQLIEAEQVEINSKKEALYSLASLEKSIGKTVEEK